MKKFLIIKLVAIFFFLFAFFFLVISFLAVLGYSVGSEINTKNYEELRRQSYLENNNLYADTYKSLLDKYLYEYGYVSMERIVWYLQETNNITNPNDLPFEIWEDAYLKNINQEERQMIPTSEMCQNIKKNPIYSSLGEPSYNLEYNSNKVDLCSEKYVTEHNLIYTNSYYHLPYVSPLKKETFSGISSMVNEKRNVDLGLSNSEQENVNFHSGWDLKASAETNVYSICDGVIDSVTFTQNENIPFNQQSDPKNKTGNIIRIRCDGTNDIVTYNHLFPNSYTSKMIVGNTVNKGQLIAKVGTTGQSTGNHLHLGLYTDSGIRLDAFYFINFGEYTLYHD